jgi:hypothetical protein
VISSIGFVFLLGDVLIFSLFFPGWFITHEHPDRDPARLRRRLLVLAALISGFPIISVIFWDHLGLPTDAGWWVGILLFLFANITTLLMIPLVSYISRGHAAGIVAAVGGFVLLVAVEIIAPPAITLIKIYSQEALVNPQTLQPDSCDDQTVEPIFAHISDLHITERQSTRDGKQPGNGKLTPLLQRVNERRPPFLIISGDITDEGTATQWRIVEQLFRPLHSKTKVLVSTGNHDLNYFFGSDPEEHPWTWFGLRPLVGIDAEPRIFRAAEFQARHLDQVHTSAGELLRDVTTDVPNESNLDHFQRQIGECALSCVSNVGVDPGDVKLQIASCPGSCAHDLDSIRFHYFHDLSQSFPLYYYDEVSLTAFISMTTSMAESTEVGRNAIGLSGEDQIKNLKAVLDLLPSSVRYIVLIQHHPLLWSGVPGLPRFPVADLLHPKKAVDAFYTSPWFLAVFLHNDIAEGAEIYALLQSELAKRPGTAALVVFGHRHERSLSRIGPITFEEAPNLATEEKGNYGFYLVGKKANALSISWCEIGGK